MSMTPGRTGGGTNGDTGRETVEGSDEAARLPSLEEQTPGLDREQDEQTLKDAKAFYGGEGGRGGDDNNDALMSEQDIQESGK